MIIQAVRIKQGFESTLSSLIVDKVVRGFWLEDDDKGLSATMTPAQIAKIKVHGRTAIPVGRYRVLMTDSKRFGKIMPELMKVPGYEGIRIHKGNYVGNTEGCMLPGKIFDKDKNGYYRVWDSGKVFDPLVADIEKAIRHGEEVWFEISRTYKITLPA